MSIQQQKRRQVKGLVFLADKLTALLNERSTYEYHVLQFKPPRNVTVPQLPQAGTVWMSISGFRIPRFLSDCYV